MVEDRQVSSTACETRSLPRNTCKLATGHSVRDTKKQYIDPNGNKRATSSRKHRQQRASQTMQSLSRHGIPSTTTKIGGGGRPGGERRQRQRLFRSFFTVRRMLYIRLLYSPSTRGGRCGLWQPPHHPLKGHQRHGIRRECPQEAGHEPPPVPSPTSLLVYNHCCVLPQAEAPLAVAQFAAHWVCHETLLDHVGWVRGDPEDLGGNTTGPEVDGRGG